MIDLSDPKNKGYWINWDMDHSFRDGGAIHDNLTRETWQQSGFNRQFGNFDLKNHCFQSILFSFQVDEHDDYREEFLRLLVEVLNHRLTHEYLQSRVDYYKKMLIQYGEPHVEYFTMLDEFIKHRPRFILEEVKEKWSLLIQVIFLEQSKFWWVV